MFDDLLALVCMQLIVYTFMGDMQFVYRILGHHSDFLRDTFRCIYCTYNFRTKDAGTPRDIAHFSNLASRHKQNPSRRGEGTYNIVYDPVFPIPLENVVPFFLHCFLGLFCRSVDSFKKDLRGIDRRIVNPENRNPVAFEVLEGKLEQLTLQVVNARESAANSKMEETVIKERIADVATILDPIYSGWKCADDVRVIGRKNMLSEEELLEFIGHREVAIELISELDEKHK